MKFESHQNIGMRVLLHGHSDDAIRRNVLGDVLTQVMMVIQDGEAHTVKIVEHSKQVSQDGYQIKFLCFGGEEADVRAKTLPELMGKPAAPVEYSAAGSVGRVIDV